MRLHVTQLVTEDLLGLVLSLIHISLDYPTAFRSMTSGKGVYASAFLGYQECPPGEGKEAPRRGVDPLDHAKWILTTRSAMQ